MHLATGCQWNLESSDVPVAQIIASRSSTWRAIESLVSKYSQTRTTHHGLGSRSFQYSIQISLESKLHAQDVKNQGEIKEHKSNRSLHEHKPCQSR